MVFFILMLIFLVLLPTFLIWLLYLVAKKLGNEKIGKILAGVFSVLYLLFWGSFIFEDELFFKSDARDILAKQNIVLKDDFEIKDNDISGGIGAYYQIFVLEISAEDKQRLIDEYKKGKDTLRYWESEKSYFIGRGKDNFLDAEYAEIPKSDENILTYHIMND